MATADKRRDARESGGKIRRSATQLGLSAQRTRLIVRSQRRPRETTSRWSRRWPTLSSSGHSITAGPPRRGPATRRGRSRLGSELHALHSRCTRMRRGIRRFWHCLRRWRSRCRSGCSPHSRRSRTCPFGRTETKWSSVRVVQQRDRSQAADRDCRPRRSRRARAGSGARIERMCRVHAPGGCRGERLADLALRHVLHRRGHRHHRGTRRRRVSRCLREGFDELLSLYLA